MKRLAAIECIFRNLTCLALCVPPGAMIITAAALSRRPRYFWSILVLAALVAVGR